MKFDHDAKDGVFRLVKDRILAGNHRNQGKCLGTNPGHFTLKVGVSATMALVLP